MSELAPSYRQNVLRHTNIIVTTTNDCVGFTVIEYLGIVRGIVVRSLSFGQGLVGGLKTLAGGNIVEYTEVCDAARRDAFTRMMEQAETVGAHAIIGMRYDATEFNAAATEVLAYGTAVRLAR
jgi:uncharacterized protein YbjQ (UPF0145 family)